MAEFATNSKGNAALTTGIIGTSLGGLLATGGLNGLFGGGGNCSENMAVNRYELGKENEITQLKMEKALLESNIFTDSKMGTLYDKMLDRIERSECSMNQRIDGINAQLAQQAVWNATQAGLVSCLQGQIAQLQSLTKLIIPKDSVCPSYMPEFNSWTAPTAA